MYPQYSTLTCTSSLTIYSPPKTHTEQKTKHSTFIHKHSLSIISSTMDSAPQHRFTDHTHTVPDTLYHNLTFQASHTAARTYLLDAFFVVDSHSCLRTRVPSIESSSPVGLGRSAVVRQMMETQTPLLNNLYF